MSEPDDDVRAHAAALAADLRTWLEWAALTGANELPISPPAQVEVAPARPVSPTSRAQLAPDAPPRPPASFDGRPPPSWTPSPPSAAPHEPGPPGMAPPPRSPAQRPATSPSSTPVPRVSPRAASAVSTAPPPTSAVAAGAAGLDQVRKELGDCQRCRLGRDRKNLVFGVGSPTASLLIIGEGPGEQEDMTGEPFVGRSGQLLTRMLAAIGLTRDEVYICNIIKCRPPQNRDPLPDEIATCSPFVHRQVQAVQPKVILTLGRFAAVNLIGVDAPMGELRKRVGSLHGVPVVPTYHPSYLLRTPRMKRQAWEDLLTVRRLVRQQQP